VNPKARVPVQLPISVTAVTLIVESRQIVGNKIESCEIAPVRPRPLPCLDGARSGEVEASNHSR